MDHDYDKYYTENYQYSDHMGNRNADKENLCPNDGTELELKGTSTGVQMVMCNKCDYGRVYEQ